MSKRSIAALTLFACAALFGGWLTAARAADAPYEVPVIASLTGFGAFLGKAQQDTLTRLETLVNRQGGIKGRPLHFAFYDDQTSPQVAVQLTNEIIAKKASVLLGPTLTNQCIAVMPLVQGKLVEYCISPGIHPAKDSYSFSASISTTDLIKSFFRYFHARGLNRIAVLTTTDATGQDADRNFAAVVALPEFSGLQIVDEEYMAVSDVSVAAQIAKMKAARPQAMLAWVIGTPFATVLRGINDGGLDVPVGASNANMTFAQMKQWGSYLPKDLYFPGVPFMAGMTPNAQAKSALQDFYAVTKAQGVEPDFQTGISWDPGVILVTALKQLGPDATPEQIRDYIEKMHGFAGIAGVYDFRDGSQRGLTQKDVVIMRWDPAKTNWTAVSKLGGAPL